mgnify:CR=1 FL=1
MTIKIMLSVGLLVSAFLPDLQAMGGARDFARNLFLSKTGAFAGAVGCINGAVFVYRMDKAEEDLVKNCMDPHLPLSVDKTIKDIFAQDGIAVEILKSSDNSMPVGVLHHQGKSMLILSKEVIDKLTDQPRFFEKLSYVLPDTITKDEIFASLEHEKSHLKDYDLEKRLLLQATYLPSVILGMKAARLWGRGKLVTGAIGLTQMYLSGLFHHAFIRQQEKKCDLSLTSSKHALALVSFFEKFHTFESEKIVHINSLPGGQGVTIKDLQSYPLDLHPPYLERAQYLRDHARFLEEQERAKQENKK